MDASRKNRSISQRHYIAQLEARVCQLEAFVKVLHSAHSDDIAEASLILNDCDRGYIWVGPEAGLPYAGYVKLADFLEECLRDNAALEVAV